MELVQQAKQPSKSNAVVFVIPGVRGTVRVARKLFVNGAPQTLVIDSDAFVAPAPPKVKMTAEERKAARAAAPKLTEAEKIARDEKRLAERKAKLAAD